MALGNIDDTYTLVLGTGCADFTYYRKRGTTAFFMYQLYNNLLYSFMVLV